MTGHLLGAALAVCLGSTLASRTLTATPPQSIFDPAAPPAAWAPAVARADAAIAELQRRLGSRLAAALKEGGPANAVTACRDDAPRLSAEIGREQGVAIGRTSDRLRNPRNVAPAWAREAVAAATGRAATAVRPIAIDLGDRIGVMRPIVAGQMCTRCHGAREKMGGELLDRLAREYPDDQAIGYAAGDHRGFFWVEVRK